MKCPQCSDILITLEFDRIEIDYCPRCEGVWLDSGELALLLAREGGSALVGTFRPVSGKERKRTCPICSRAMKKILAGGNGSILLDECPDHGLWFDRGELKKTLAAGCSGIREEGREDSLTRLLDEIFVPCGEESR